LSYITRWYPREHQGTVLGILGAGNVGSAITKLGAPWVMLAYGWQGVVRLWAVLLVGAAAIFWVGSTEDPKQAARRASGEPAPCGRGSRDNHRRRAGAEIGGASFGNSVSREGCDRLENYG